MKAVIFLLLFAVTNLANGQTDTANKIHHWQPVIFLDSVLISKQQLNFDIKKIVNITLDGAYYDSTQWIHGKVFLTSLFPKNYHFLTTADVLRTYTEVKTTPIIFMVENNFLKDTSGFKIDSDYILRVEIIKASEFDYLKKLLPDLTIIKIITKTRENLDKLYELRLKGKTEKE